MNAQPRYAILAEGRFSPLESKTANQALRYIPERVAAVIDRRHAGKMASDVLGFGGAVPVVGDLESALAHAPTALLIGIAPMGGILPQEWRAVLLDALRRRLDLVSGLHTLLSDDEELAACAREHGAAIRDLRRVASAYERVATGSWRTRKARTILTVGTDCNVGKMTASFELHKEFERRHQSSAFVATGQTGILLAGRGIAVDSVLSDYVAGAIEWELDELASGGARYLHVEGQGSITHQGYSAVTMGLLHGVMPDAMILVHHPARDRDDYGFRLDDIPRAIALHESLIAPYKPSRVAGIAVNGVGMTPSAMRQAKDALRTATGLPVADILVDGPGELTDALLRTFSH